MAQADPLSETTATDSRLSQPFEDGRRAGLATAALALGVVSFFSLFGAEKAILAIALGLIALRGSQPGSAGRRLAKVAIALGVVFLVSIVFVLVTFRNELLDLLNHLRQLS